MTRVGVVLCALMIGSPAAATVLLDESGVFTDQWEQAFDWDHRDAARRYRLSVATDRPVFATTYFVSGYCDAVHDPDGSLVDQVCDEVDETIAAGQGTLFVKAFTTRGFQMSGPEDCFEGYTCTRASWNQLQGLFLTAQDEMPVGYHVRLVSTRVPEPATWALLVAGFGLAGASLRRGLRTHA